MRKKLTRGLVMLLVTLSIAGTSSVLAIEPEEVCPPEELQGIEISHKGVARAEETTWYNRMNDGCGQLREWSNTYGYWKTDWLYICSHSYHNPKL